MIQKYNPALRVISTIVLSFFLWTFGGVFEVAYAIKDRDASSVMRDERKQNQAPTPNAQAPHEKRSEEKFSKAIEDIDDILKDDKADHETKKQRIKSKKAEIDADDVELRKQFTATEAKIKDLPDVIKKRHRDFVKHYDDNLRELKANLEEIDKAKDKAEVEAKVEKAKRHIEKVKTPKRHQKLDPNKLPHRTPDVEHKEPRTKPEEFEKEQGQVASGMALNPTLAKGGEGGFFGQSAKPILVAANGPLDGLLSSPTPKFLNPASFDSPIPNTKSPSPVLLALANPPTNDDLAENGIEIVFTTAIRAKAAELGYKPVKIYEWVRNNIEYVPTYGSIQGADMCLQTKLCNDFDTASLLIALLRASGVHARYVYGTIELPIEKVKNWAGGFTDTNSAMAFIATGGIPLKGITEGGAIVAAQIEHAWVEVWIDMIPSQGAVHKQGDTWIPLDASYKQYEYTLGIDLSQAVPFDSESFVNQIKSNATINETTGSVTGIDNNAISLAVSDYSSRMKDYILTNLGDKTGGDIIGKKKIIQKEQPIFFAALPYKTVVKGWQQAELPQNLRQRISFSLTDEYGTGIFSYSVTLPEIADKRISVSFSPASQTDEDTIMRYYPSAKLPAYLISLKPELRLDGQVVNSGPAVQMGTIQNLAISFSGPVRSWNETISNKTIAGEYYEIGLNTSGSINRDYSSWMQELQRIKTDISNNNIAALNREDIIGQNLEGLIKAYFYQYNLINFIKTKQARVVRTVLPSMGMAIQAMKVEYMWGAPFTAGPGGISMDVDRLYTVTIAQDGDKQKKIDYSLETGIWSSALEHMIPELFYQETDNTFESISAIKAIQIASDLSIPIYRLDKSNYESVKPLLSLGSDTRVKIESAVNAGKTVITPSRGFSYKQWSGIGYLILDTNTGAGAYMIGGMSGSEEVNDLANDVYSAAMTGLALNLQANVGLITGVFERSFRLVNNFSTFFGPCVSIALDLAYSDFQLKNFGSDVVDMLVDWRAERFIIGSFSKAAACLYLDQYSCALIYMSQAFVFIMISVAIKQGLKKILTH